MIEPLQDTQPQEITKVYGTVPRKNIEIHGETHGGHMKRERDDTHAMGTHQRACVAVSHTWPLTQQGQFTQRKALRRICVLTKTADDDKEPGEKTTWKM